jgi:hypothetical protein
VKWQTLYFSAPSAYSKTVGLYQIWPRESPYTPVVQSDELPMQGKAIPLQALTSPEGSRRLRLPNF